MVGKKPVPTPSVTKDALASLNEAERKILSSLKSAAGAFRALSDPATSNFNGNAAAFVSDLYAAQAIIRNRIESTGADLSFEDNSVRRLVEADLSLQRTAHVHRAVVNILVELDEMPNPPGSLSAAASPNWMPSPVASTPRELGALATVAPSPSPAGAPITVAVPSPDAAGLGLPLSAAVTALNGSVPGGPAEAEADQAADPPSQPDGDGGDRMEI